MKPLAFILLFSSFVHAQDLSPQEQRALLKEVQDLKRRVEQLERSQGKPASGFRTTDYQQKVVQPSSAPSAPSMTEEQRKEIMETVEKYKKAQAEQEKALKELEDEE